MKCINTKELLGLTGRLIKFRSITPDQAGCIDYLEQYLKEHKFTVIRTDRNDTTNLIASYGEGDTTIAFAGHIDVVPPGNPNSWRSKDPFTLYEEDGMLYGRGISDMKGGVAAFIQAVISYVNTHDHHKFKIMLLITSDEEGRATDGTKVMVEYLQKENIKLDYVVLGEPSSVEKLGDTIKIGRRGSLTAHLEVKGIQGHIAYPQLLKNPIHTFSKVLNQLIDKVWDNGSEYFPPTSLQFSNISAGLGVDNVTPPSLYANFNFRYNDLHTHESLVKDVETILTQAGLDYEIKWHISSLPFLTKKGKLLEVVTAVIQSQLQISTNPKTDGGTSDGRFLINVCDEIVELGLINKSIHQIDEHVPLNDLEQLSMMYYQILDKLFT